MGMFDFFTGGSEQSPEPHRLDVFASPEYASPQSVRSAGLTRSQQNAARLRAMAANERARKAAVRRMASSQDAALRARRASAKKAARKAGRAGKAKKVYKKKASKGKKRCPPKKKPCKVAGKKACCKRK